MIFSARVDAMVERMFAAFRAANPAAAQGVFPPLYMRRDAEIEVIGEMLDEIKAAMKDMRA